MKKILATIVSACILCFSAKAEVTLEQCLISARENYPLIKKLDLMNSTREIDITEINRSWLPKLGVYAQGSIQNVVPSFPSALSNVMAQVGGDIKGIEKLQYRIGFDLQQTVWDGGASKLRREIARCRADLDQTAIEVDIYSLNQRIEALYFGILLLNEQIEKTESTCSVYEANLHRLNSMLANGVAMQSDADMLEAQLLQLKQQLTQARSAMTGYRTVLSIFTGLDLNNETLLTPTAEIPESTTSNRPELALFKSRIALNSIQKNFATVDIMPKVGLFAQSYYGYPGIDYFKAMTSRELTFNIVAGVKVSWNVDAFYNKKSTVKKLDIANAGIEADSETFQFNTQMQAASQLEEIKGLKTLIQGDERIIQLRQNVRKAAESQLRNGVIDATGLITKINDETQAQLAASYHSIQIIQAIFNLKNTINR